jgi:polyferredoxin
VWLYGVLVLLVLSIFVGGLSTRKGFAVDVIKDRGAMARETGTGDIENIYRLKIMNTTERTQTYTASVQGLSGMALAGNSVLSVPPAGIGSLTVRLTLSTVVAQEHQGKAIPIMFRVETPNDGKITAVEEKSTFVIPR